MNKAIFKTIREAAREGFLNESALRRMYSENKLPGVQVGSRYYVNCEKLKEQLQIPERSLSHVGE